MTRMKRLLPLLLALIFIIQAIPFTTSATTVGEGEGVLDVYKYNESTKEEIFVASYAKTGSDTSAAVTEALNAINNDFSVNAHFIIKLNEDIVYPTTTLKYNGASGERTVTIDGRNTHKMITLNNYNGIFIDGRVSNIDDYSTKPLNVNLSNLKIHHTAAGSAVQFYSRGSLTLSNCELIVDGEDHIRNYAVINMMAGEGETASLSIFDTTILVIGREQLNEKDPTKITTSGLIRTGNANNNINITIDGSTIKSSAVQSHLIHVVSSTSANINITNSMLGVAPNQSANVWSAPIFSHDTTAKINITLGSTMFYRGCEPDGEGGLTDGEVITDPNGAIRAVNGDLSNISTTYTGYTSIGGYNIFPELIITEVHLESINANSSAGPFYSPKNWATMDWWKDYGDHPGSVSGFGSNDFFRYIEVYNASAYPIDLYSYKLIIDTDAIASDTSVNELDIRSGTVGSVTNEPTEGILQPGKIAVLYLYNAVDRDLGCTVENFKGYYEWRYNGQDPELDAIPNANGTNTNLLTPSARDPHLIVDLEDITVIAVDDIGSTHSSTKLGSFRTNSIYYGLAKDTVVASEMKTDWTSWALFERYVVTDSNQADQSTFNFLYGLDASADIREGRRMNEARITYNCNPGLLQELQKLNFPYSNPNHTEAPTITITEINNFTDVDLENKGYDGDFDYFEVANISSERINIYDYCVFQQYALTTDPFDFSSHYFNQISYIIPSVGKDGTAYGDIQCFTAKNNQAGETGKMLAYTGPNRTVRYTNPEYSMGWLEPGETAILWMYDESSYINGVDLTDFRNFFEGTSTDTSKVFALSGFRNQQGEQGTNSIGISNTSCSLFGIGKLENFTRETANEHQTVTGNNGGTGETIYTNTYPEVKKDKVYFADSNKYPDLYKNGFSILDCECVVFMFASMINGGGTKDAQLGEVNTAYQYASAYVNGTALRFAGFLATIFPDGIKDANGEVTKNTVVTQEWMASPTVLLDVQNTLIESFTRNTFEITYNANGGSGAAFKQFARSGEKVALSNGSAFSKAGSYIVGWSKTSGNNSSKKDYVVGETVQISEDTVLYAVWGDAPPSPTYVITIPETISFTNRNNATMIIEASLSNFTASQGVDIVISSEDTLDNKRFLMHHATDSQHVPSIRYTIFNYDTGAMLQNNSKVTTFTDSSNNYVYIYAECEQPSYAGTYQGMLTFQVVFNDNINN